MTIKKPIVIYDGHLKQIQPSDQTPGESAAAVAKSYAGVAEFRGTSLARRAESQGLLDNSLADYANSLARRAESQGLLDNSIADRGSSIATRSISLARLADLQSMAHVASTLETRMFLVSSEAERAQSLARVAVESSDISEAASIAIRGKSIAVRAQSIAQKSNSLAHIALDEIVVIVITNIYNIQSHDEIIVVDRTSPTALYLPPATGSEDKHAIKNINKGLVTVWGDGTDTIDTNPSVSISRWNALVFVDYAVGKWALI